MVFKLISHDLSMHEKFAMWKTRDKYSEKCSTFNVFFFILFDQLFCDYGRIFSLLVWSSLVLLIISAGGLCKTKADVIVLIQDSRSISEGIRSSIQCIVRTLLTSLNSDDTDYKFVMGRYGSKTKMNSWGSAASAIYYVNYEYLKGGLGPYNRLNRVLKKKVPKKFDERSAHRKGKDSAKV